MAKILIVDDAAFMRKVIRDTLTKSGYTDIYEAVDGKDAVEKYFELKPDLVLMDITMQMNWAEHFNLKNFLRPLFGLDLKILYPFSESIDTNLLTKRI